MSDTIALDLNTSIDQIPSGEIGSESIDDIADDVLNAAQEAAASREEDNSEWTDFNTLTSKLLVDEKVRISGLLGSKTNEHKKASTWMYWLIIIGCIILVAIIIRLVLKFTVGI